PRFLDFATLRAKIARKKKPGRYARNDRKIALSGSSRHCLQGKRNSSAAFAGRVRSERESSAQKSWSDRGLLAVAGGEFAKLGDGSGDGFERIVDLGSGGMATEAEADAGAGFVSRKADGGEDVRRLDRAGRARGAGGTGDALHVESDDESLAFDSWKRDVGGVRGTRRGNRVDTSVRHSRNEALFELVAKRGDARGVLSERIARELGGFAETDDSGNVFRARTEAALMMTAIEKLLEPRAAANVESADSLRSVEFVRGEGKQIHAEFVNVHGELSNGLHGVGVKVDIVLRRDAADFLERLDGAEFVVGVHDGNEAGVRANGFANRFGIDEAIAIHRQVGDTDASPANVFFGATCRGGFNRLAGVEDGFVFEVGGDDVLGGTGSIADDAEDGVIVRFGAAAGEDDFLGTRVEKSGDLFASGFHGGPGALADGVDRRGVAEFRRKIGQHRVEDLGIDGGGGVMVEVDAVHVIAYPE